MSADDDLIEQIAARRGDAEFMERLRLRMAEDAPILDALADHQCRFPKPNTEGFPVNQCLDCGGWIIAAPDMTPPPRPQGPDDSNYAVHPHRLTRPSYTGPVTAKRMLSLRIDGRVADSIDHAAAAAGQTRTEWMSTVVARAALTAAGRPQAPVDTGDKR